MLRNRKYELGILVNNLTNNCSSFATYTLILTHRILWVWGKNLSIFCRVCVKLCLNCYPQLILVRNNTFVLTKPVCANLYIYIAHSKTLKFQTTYPNHRRGNDPLSIITGRDKITRIFSACPSSSASSSSSSFGPSNIK